MFHVDWCAFLFGYVCDLNWNYSVCIEVYRKENGMDPPGFASPGASGPLPTSTCTSCMNCEYCFGRKEQFGHYNDVT